MGYIGLPTAAVFAGRRLKVVGVDVSAHAVDTINRGEIHITEPDLDIVVRAVVTEGYLRATATPEPADAFLIAVPWTPLWDLGTLVLAPTALGDWVRTGWVRGGISGLGALDLIVAGREARRLLRSMALGKGEPKAAPRR